MRKKRLEIINFVNLSDEKYRKILEYRNQEYVRTVSNSPEPITVKQHEAYREALKKRDKFFAFLITCDGEDYAVINLKKLDDGSFYLGYYLTDELYKFEGGGVAVHNCMMYICDRLKIKLISYDIKPENSRVFRVGRGGEDIAVSSNSEALHHLVRLYGYDDERVKNSKSAKLFNKIYEIKGGDFS